MMRCALNRFNRRGLTRAAPPAGASFGFTLIEILVALAILASVMVAAQQGFSGALSGLDRSERYARAAALARSKLTELELQPGLTAGYNASGEDEQSGLQWQMAVRPYEEEDLLPPRRVTPLAARVEISWSDAGRDRSIVVESMLLALERRNR